MAMDMRPHHDHGRPLAKPPAAHTDDHSAHADAAREHGSHDHREMIVDFRRRFWVSIVLTVPILLLSPMIQHWLNLGDALGFPGSDHVLFALSSIVFFYGGWPFLTGLARELSAAKPGMMTLIALAITVAYLFSSAVVFGVPGEAFFWELATLIDVMLLGHWIEMRSVLGASGALEALVRLLPAEAHRMRTDGAVEDVPVSQIGRGDRLLVKPGEKVPIDGVIVEGRSSLNESMLTGESKPVARGPGEEAIGGSVNGEGAIAIRVDKTGDQTYLAQVIELVRQAQATRSRTQDLANRAALWLTYIALGVGGVTLFGWLLLGGTFAFAIERAVTVMVISCPHALGLAVPLVVAVSTSLTARNGLLIRDRAAFERARQLQAIVFDKTGTLTKGEFGVSDIVALGSASEQDVLSWAAALESQSEHPIAGGIVRAARERKIAERKVDSFRNLTGQGAEARVDGHDVKVVSPGYLRAHGLAVEDPRVQRLAEQGKTVVYVLLDGAVLGAIALGDLVREESRAAVQQLKAMGLQCIMLTGDAKAVAKTVSNELGLDDYFAEVLPADKAAKIREVQGRGLTVAMVGDGVNDAPALTQSDLGIAIGAGTDVAIESADVVLVRNDPRDVVAILGLSRATYDKMVQNLLWATGYNAIAIPLAAGVAMPLGIVLSPAVGAALMSVSTVIVAINAKLLERTRVIKPA
jgi:Cu2+-exporting ATPase